MIPLGSCTMKLNATARCSRSPGRSSAGCTRSRPPTRRRATRSSSSDLEAWLAEITGFAAVSLQPNAGSQGEYAGPARHPRATTRAAARRSRNVCLIPVSAHGTNPASAVDRRLQGRGRRLRRPAATSTSPTCASKAAEHKDDLAALMVTYPSTHGVFEESIREICEIVHEHGGQVYMDGANMNAQVGLTPPRRHRRRRLPPEPAQDLLHPARRRRAGHGADRRRRAPRAVPARPSR